MKLVHCDGTSSCPHCAMATRLEDAANDHRLNMKPSGLMLEAADYLRSLQAGPSRPLEAQPQCENCETAITGDWNFCPKCGLSFIPAPPADTPATEPKLDLTAGPFRDYPPNPNMKVQVRKRGDVRWANAVPLDAADTPSDKEKA